MLYDEVKKNIPISMKIAIFLNNCLLSTWYIFGILFYIKVILLLWRL